MINLYYKISIIKLFEYEKDFFVVGFQSYDINV
jgi:hypothetical protein